MNVYFEYPEQYVGHTFGYLGDQIPARYCARYNVSIDADGDPILPVKLMYMAERVWQEDETGVKYLKHRGAWLSDVHVDEKEFLWIKLSATRI